jgi:hypothetical protein
MSVIIINDVFTEEQLNTLHKIMSNIATPTIELHSEFPHDHEKCDPITAPFDPTIGIDRVIGRVQNGCIDDHLSEDIKNRVLQIVEDILGEPCAITHALHSTYSNEYGSPNLPPHLDGTPDDIIINFQLTSNTSWDLAINTEIYSIEDNGALVFNPNTEIHWRPHKTFNDGEYIQMIFFRCHKVGSKCSFSYMYDTPSIDINKIIADANKVRDSL